ncbi:hypothetical protein [Cohnella abietis]|uniref:Uncharacterized protein n=1 Tax=Cohnella abietis TaxID=2507935 RepID=A0A3T1D559_9BACL|nr:hypothetical protein [Cohnella abietis]BBI33178.1 hypothetical protein KCTCHS21_25770 [Cohnella abietis]
MPPVFGSVFLWILTTILWWSGWRKETTEGIPHWAVGFFLAVWPLALLSDIVVTSTYSVNGAELWTMLAALAMLGRLRPARILMSISAGVLIGSIYLLLSRLLLHPSGITHYFAPWGAAILVGWLAALLLRYAVEQFVAVSAGLLICEIMTNLLMTSSEFAPIVKASGWMEAWWIAVLYARLWSVSIQSITVQLKRWALKWGWTRGGQSS